MDLSIIIPMYNASKYVDNCMQSIANQIWLPDQFEIIIVDDGSIDNSKSLVDSWKSKLPIKLLTQKNQKQAIARNHGLDFATGKFILFIDIDDDMKPNMIQQLCQNIENNDLVESGINKIFVNSDGRIIRSELELPAIRHANNQSELIQLYFGANTECDVGLWNKLFRRSIIDQNQLRFTNANFFEDSLFVGQYLGLINYTKIKFIKQPLYNFYKRQGSTTTSFHSEIDMLSEAYLSKCEALLKTTGLSAKNQENISAVLNLRIWIYTIHHHVKYDQSWNVKRQRRYLTCKVGISNSFKPGIPNKYRIAFWTMFIVPLFYNKLYIKRHLA